MTGTTTLAGGAAPGTRRRESLSDTSVSYLLAATGSGWPGVDGLLVADVLKEYPMVAAAGFVPDEILLCERHPDIASQVVAFFFLSAFANSRDV